MVATPRVGLLAFEPLLELRASLNSYTHNNSNNSEWSVQQLAGLRTQLEGARGTIRYLHDEITAHQRILANWKPSDPSSHNDNKRRHEGTDKKNKKRRVHEDYKLAEHDSSYSSYSSPEEEGSAEADVDVDGDEGSGDMDGDGDVDVDVDVEALDHPDEGDEDDKEGADEEAAHKEDEYVPKIKRGTGGRNSMAQMIVRRHQGKPSSSASARRQKFKNLNSANSRGGRLKSGDVPPAASPTESYDAGVAGAAVSSSESEEETTPVPLGSGAFWTAMEPYLRPPTDRDLEYITPKAQRADDPIFTIPTLGLHYSQGWTDDGAASPPPRHAVRSGLKGEEAELSGANGGLHGGAGGGGIGGGTGGGLHGGVNGAINGGTANGDADPVMGDITRRILQSLIDEHIIMNRPPSPFPDESPVPFDDNKENTTSSIPTIPVVNYSRAQMVALEGRIKLELHAIGLLDDEDPIEREDDEVCAELRLNQSLLKEQIAINNEQRIKLIALVKAKMLENEENNKQKAFNTQIEKNYQKLVQRKKKRGGRRQPSHVGT